MEEEKEQKVNKFQLIFKSSISVCSKGDKIYWKVYISPQTAAFISTLSEVPEAKKNYNNRNSKIYQAENFEEKKRRKKRK